MVVKQNYSYFVGVITKETIITKNRSNVLAASFASLTCRRQRKSIWYDISGKNGKFQFMRLINVTFKRVKCRQKLDVTKVFPTTRPIT